MTREELAQLILDEIRRQCIENGAYMSDLGSLNDWNIDGYFDFLAIADAIIAAQAAELGSPSCGH